MTSPDQSPDHLPDGDEPAREGNGAQPPDSYRASRPEEFDPSIVISEHAERAFAALHMDRDFCREFLSDQLIEKHRSWCKAENTGRRRLRQFDPERIRGPIVDTLKQYWQDLRDTVQYLDPTHPTFPVRAHAVGAYEVVSREDGKYQVALVEIINRDGHYLAFDGQSIELNAAGPVFNHVASPLAKGGEQCVLTAYSAPALKERLSVLQHDHPSIASTYSDPEEHTPHLLFEIALALEEHLSSPKGMIVPEIEDVKFHGHSDTPDVYRVEYGGLQLEARIALNRFGFVDIAIGERT